MFVHTEPRSAATHPRPFALFSPSFEGSREGLGSPSSLPAGPQQLLFYKQLPPITDLESTLLKVFILRNLKSPGINTFKKTGEGVVTMVNHLLETSHPLSSPAPRLRGSVAAPSFHSPYLLQSSVSRKSCICHSCRNTGGVGVFFPNWNGCRGPKARAHVRVIIAVLPAFQPRKRA